MVDLGSGIAEVGVTVDYCGAADSWVVLAVGVESV